MPLHYHSPAARKIPCQKLASSEVSNVLDKHVETAGQFFQSLLNTEMQSS